MSAAGLRRIVELAGPLSAHLVVEDAVAAQGVLHETHPLPAVHAIEEHVLRRPSSPEDVLVVYLAGVRV